MANGGVIGKNNRPTSNIARGIWDLNELYHARLDSEWPGSALEVDVGTFQIPVGTGTQVVNLSGGKTWTPKCIIFFTAGSTAAAGTWLGAILQMIGFTAGPSNSYAVGGYSQDGGASNTARRMAAAALTFPWSDGSATPNHQADLASFDPGSFTLNWTNNQGDRSHVMYVALGGDIQAKVTTFASPAATGSQAYSGIGFQSDLIFFAAAPNNAAIPYASTTMQTMFGAANSSLEQWAVSLFSQDAQPTTNTSRFQRTDSCLAIVSTNELEAFRANLTGVGADNFTLNWATTAQVGHHFAALCIKGVKSKLFTKTRPASSASWAETGVGFKPSGLLFATTRDQTSSTTPATEGLLAIGATDGTTQRTAHQQDREGLGAAQAKSVWYSDRMFTIPRMTAADNGYATFTSFDADGWTATWGNISGDQINQQYLVCALAGKD